MQTRRDAALDSKTYVLIHGAFHGGWCWEQVAALLRTGGHTVLAPTLPGLGDRAHLIVERPTLDTFIGEVAATIEAAALDRVILVGHSFAGSVVSGLADRMPERLRHLVYLDSVLIRSGQQPLDNLLPDVIERFRQQAAASSTGLSVPPPSAAYFGITDPAQQEWVASRLTPHPFSTYASKLTLQHPLGNGVPATYIACSQPFFASTARSRELARTIPGWAYQEIATGHEAMLTAPAELTRMLLAFE